MSIAQASRLGAASVACFRLGTESRTVADIRLPGNNMTKARV
jgi:hypothetical protein